MESVCRRTLCVAPQRPNSTIRKERWFVVSRRPQPHQLSAKGQNIYFRVLPTIEITVMFNFVVNFIEKTFNLKTSL